MSLSGYIKRFLIFTLIVIGYGNSASAAPGDILFQEQFNNTTDFTSDWTQSGSGLVQVNGATYSSSFRSLMIGERTATVTSRANRINASVPFAELSIWVRRGHDAFSENPDTNENLTVQYLNNGGTWVTLGTYPGAGTPGQIFTPVFVLPANALYNNLRLRFVFARGSGSPFDYWHIDDVVVTERSLPTLPSVSASWQFEEAQWTGAANEVLDNSGNAIHGTIVNNPVNTDTSPAITGNPGTCRYGSFQRGSQQYVRLPHDPLLNPNGSFTLALWARVDGGQGGWRSPFTSRRENGSQRQGYFVYAGTNNRWQFWTGNGTGWDRVDGPLVNVGVWTHVTVTFSVTSTSGQVHTGIKRIYINGVLATSVSGRRYRANISYLATIGAGAVGAAYYFQGPIDEVRIYKSAFSLTQIRQVMNETHPCGLTFDHFAIDVGGGSASTCAAQAITITAQDSSNNKIDDYIGQMTLATSTNHGRWQNTSTPADAEGALTPSGLDNGAAAYQFELSELDNGDVTLELNNTHAETLTITATDTDSGTSFTSSPLTFSENAFVISNTDSLASDIVAGRNHNFHAEMVRRDPSTGDCGPAADYNVADIKAWITPDAADPGGTLPALQTVSETQSLPATLPVAANLSVPFVSGVADFTLNTTDVGKYAFNFRDDSLTFSDAAISGGSNILIVRPFGFDIQVAGNPAAVDANGGVLATAGNNFTASARAVGWSSADDSNDDGIPDGHDDNDASNNANLNNNATTASFGQESPVENLRLSATLKQPTGASDPGLGDGDTSAADARLLNNFSGGSDTTNQVFYDEVGIIEIAAVIEDSDYLGAGASITGRTRSVSGYVGRFIPDKFVLIENDTVGGVTVQSDINENCSSFSYMDNNFTAAYYLSAVNSKGAITTNYRSSFAKLTAGDAYNFGAMDQITNQDLSTRVTHLGTTTNWASDINGIGGIDYGYGELVSTLSIGRAATPDGSYTTVNIGVIPTETADGTTIPAIDFDLDVNNDATNDTMLIDETATELRFGRLRLDDAFGPETVPLPTTFATEYWNGSIFTLNTSDSCTAIATSAITYPDGAISTVANRTITVGSGNTIGSYGDPDINDGDVAFINGGADHFFTAPGATNTGSFNVDVDLTFYPWLRFDWNQNGNHSDDTSLPTATYTFGSYRNHDRVIYWREIF